ncbi:2-C-methyl-D-erythritol 2,4-cyclodiphosphate synthase [Dehalococcoidia bacterium]|nr:2-C-methyl-D-erythritol 2,4-cyclodiphosphate synthase [Dehalococcoidia bacterium]
MRVGIGCDSHKFTADRPLVLGGVTIAYKYGLDGHSDGDVLIHAIIDAILGAAALGDIGSHFPSNDPQYQGVQSTSLLAKANHLLIKSGWQVQNVDATIVAEHPRLSNYGLQMRQSIESCIGLEAGLVSIKATTTDGLGFTGRGEGIAVQAIACIEPIS